MKTIFLNFIFLLTCFMLSFFGSLMITKFYVVKFRHDDPDPVYFEIGKIFSVSFFLLLILTFVILNKTIKLFFYLTKNSLNDFVEQQKPSKPYDKY